MHVVKISTFTLAVVAASAVATASAAAVRLHRRSTWYPRPDNLVETDDYSDQSNYRLTPEMEPYHYPQHLPLGSTHVGTRYYGYSNLVPSPYTQEYPAYLGATYPGSESTLPGSGEWSLFSSGGSNSQGTSYEAPLHGGFGAGMGISGTPIAENPAFRPQYYGGMSGLPTRPTNHHDLDSMQYVPPLSLTRTQTPRNGAPPPNTESRAWPPPAYTSTAGQVNKPSNPPSEDRRVRRKLNDAPRNDQSPAQSPTDPILNRSCQIDIPNYGSYNYVDSDILHQAPGSSPTALEKVYEASDEDLQRLIADNLAYYTRLIGNEGGASSDGEEEPEKGNAKGRQLDRLLSIARCDLYLNGGLGLVYSFHLDQEGKVMVAFYSSEQLAEKETAAHLMKLIPDSLYFNVLPLNGDREHEEEVVRRIVEEYNKVPKSAVHRHVLHYNLLERPHLRPSEGLWRIYPVSQQFKNKVLHIQ